MSILDDYTRGLEAGRAELTAERDALKAELETQRSRADMWKARCNHGTDASELQPGEEAYERLRTDVERLRAQLATMRTENLAAQQVIVDAFAVAQLREDVAELVKAAQDVVDAEDRGESRYLADILDPLEDAIEPFLHKK